MDTLGWREVVQAQKRFDHLIRSVRESLAAVPSVPHVVEMNRLAASVPQYVVEMNRLAASMPQYVVEMNRAAAAVANVRLALPRFADAMLPTMPPPLTYTELNERLASLSEGMYAPPPADDDDDDEGEYSGGHGWGFIPPTV